MIFLFTLQYLYLIYLLVTTHTFRIKILYFYGLLLFTSIWGFYFSLEGYIVLLLLSELLIVMLFTLVYLTLQFSTATYRISGKFVLVFMACLLLGGFAGSQESLLPQITNLYNLKNLMTSDDFFIFFFFFFIEFNLVTCLCGLLLTIFSMFFIFFYLSLQGLAYSQQSQTKKLYLLRKQSLVHQSVTSSSYYTFQQ